MRTAICLLTKDENRYLPEWLAWHIGQGFDHFLIYDNGSKTPVLQSIPEEHRDRVTVISFPPPRDHTQHDAYEDCVHRFWPKFDWIAFIDTDEFIRVIDGRPIKAFLADYPDADAVLAKWVMYNANGLREDDGRPVRERFTKAVGFYPESMPQCKAIIRTNKPCAVGVHGPLAVYCPLNVVNEDHERVRQGGGELPANKIVVDHYFTRSLAEWREKMARGSCDPNYSRDGGWFWRMNPDMAEMDGIIAGDGKK